MKVSKQVIIYIEQELRDHNWNSFRINYWFGHVYINFKKIHDAEGIMQWETMIHDSRKTLGIYLNRISSHKIEIVSTYSKEYQTYSKDVDESYILLSDNEKEVILHFAATLTGFKKIKQTSEGSVFIFNSRNNLFNAMNNLKSFIADLRNVSINKIFILSGKNEVVFHTG